MPTAAEVLAIATQLYQQRRLQAAEDGCREVLAMHPEQAEALHLMGLIATAQGEQEAAATLIRRAIIQRPDDATFHSNLGAILKAQGQLEDAVKACQRALELKPDSAAAHYNLGATLQDQGKLDLAAQCFQRAIELRPNYDVAHNNLGTVYLAQNKFEQAADCFRRTLALKPDYAVAHYNLGKALEGQSKCEEAIECFRLAVVMQPGFWEAHFSLGCVLQSMGRLDESIASYLRVLELNPSDVASYNHLAIALQSQGKPNQAVVCLRRAIATKPDDATSHTNLGNALKEQGQLEEAVAAYRQAVELQPDWAVGHYNLGTGLQAQDKLDEAAACFRKSLELKPDIAEAFNSLGTILNSQRRLDEAVAAYRRALGLKPDYAAARSNLLLTLQYQPGTTPAELLAAHVEYDRLQAAPLRKFWRTHENDRDPDRPLRLGFVSRDFGMHPVGFFLIRPLENLDRSRFATFCYCDRNVKDELTKRFEAAATTWREVTTLSDENLAETIRADRIDILFDLAGHTSKNRLLVFARKPAPIQVSWAGYAGTTGLAAMNYILADRFEIPPEAERNYRERVIRMPDSYVCYEPPAYAPAVAALPALERGFVTFGSFNNPAKLTAPVVALWAGILKRVPQSRLVLKYKGMNEGSVHEFLISEFANQGVDTSRVECLGWSQHRDLLAEYGRIDLALDPFPYNGGLTTCEALWMGVPVITCPGETFASRHSLSHLSVVGVTETIARDLDHYVEVAAMLAADLPRLAALRSGLRQRVAASPLCDGRRFVENLATVLQNGWRQWCLNPAQGG